MKCQQQDCRAEARFEVAWPGQGDVPYCTLHTNAGPEDTRGARGQRRKHAADRGRAHGNNGQHGRHCASRKAVNPQ